MKKSVFILLIVLCSTILLSCKPKVSDWQKVQVISRTELIVPYTKFASETEVTLRFSNGTTWSGCPSRTNSEERFLLTSQEGDIVYYRYNSHYFTGKQWAR